MSTHNHNTNNDGHGHKCQCGKDGDCECEGHEIEVIELEDENGEKEDFAILDELDFENRHFVIMAPLAEVESIRNSDNVDEVDLSIEIFEVDSDDNFNILEDEALAKRLMQHLDNLIQDE